MSQVFIIFTLALAIIYAAVLIIFWIGLLKLRKSKGTQKKIGDNNIKRIPFVSVVVAARNEEETLPECLDSLLSQSYPDDRYEIIMVDDRSTDDTPAIAQSYADANTKLKVLFVVESRGESDVEKKDSEESGLEQLTGKQVALDLGVSASNGEVILNTDADCIVPPEWIENIVAAFGPEVGVVAGFSILKENWQVEPRHSNRLLAGLSNSLRFLFFKLQSLELLSIFSASAGGMSLGWALACTGNNISYRRQVYEELGGFSALGYTLADDNTFIQWVNRHSNWQIRPVCNAKTTVLTRPMDTVKKFIRQRVRWASSGLSDRFSLLFVHAAVYAFYFFLPIAVLLAAFGFSSWTPAIVILTLKLVSEFLVVSAGLKLFGRIDLLKYFLLLEPFQLLYILVCGICGLSGKGIWKGRQYGQR